MRNAIITICLVGSLIAILSAFQTGEAITMFLLAGVIPGTSMVISPSDTLVLIALIAGFVISRVTIPAFTQLFSRSA